MPTRFGSVLSLAQGREALRVAEGMRAGAAIGLPRVAQGPEVHAPGPQQLPNASGPAFCKLALTAETADTIKWRIMET